MEAQTVKRPRHMPLSLRIFCKQAASLRPATKREMTLEAIEGVINSYGLTFAFRMSGDKYMCHIFNTRTFNPISIGTAGSLYAAIAEAAANIESAYGPQ